MNKLSDITKQIINRPTQLGSSGGVLTNIAKWAMWTKYASIASFTIAIVAIVTINAVGGGLSRLKDYQSAGATDDANSGISTYATNVFDAASIISFTFSNATGSVSSDGRSVTVDIQSPDSGGIATGRHTVNIQSNSIAGYIVTVEGSGGSTALSPVDFGGSTTTNNHLINPVSGTLASPSTLGSNTWGMAIPGRSGYSAESVYTTGLPAANGGTNGGVENAANQATLRTATFGQIPSKTSAATVIESNQASGPAHDGSAADMQNIYYGVNTEPTLQAGEYSTTITYTATVKLPAAPTNLSVSPNSYKLGSGDANTVTISADSGLTSTYKVWIDLNGSQTNTPDSGEECTNLNVLSDTQLTCNMPTDDSITVDTPYAIYVQTQAASPATIPNSFTYTKPTGSTTINSGTVAVDIDDSMIPVVYTGSTTTSGGKWTSVSIADIKADPTKWFDYTGDSTNGDGPHWANAVTVNNPENYRESGIDIPQSEIKGYWVYIPRYAYRVQRRDASNSTVSAQNFDIVFETKSTPKKIPVACSGNYLSCSSSTYGAETGTGWATHPAFTWTDGTEAGTTELNGFWIGKFETTGSIKEPTVLPNQYHKANEYIGVFYDIAKSIGQPDPNNTYGNGTATTSNAHNLTVLSSHMLKNSEWGAVAYLASSKYGAGIASDGSSNVKNNASKDDSTGSDDGDGKDSASITGCGPYDINGSTTTYNCSGDITHQYQSDIGQLASTTNNEYGVYDMAAGAYEYVMGNYSTNLSQSGGSTTYMKTAVKPPYVDIYNITSNNSCTWNTNGSGCGGHALFETAGWGGDYANFVYSSFPWFLRGGYWYNGTGAGVFYSSYSGGSNFCSSGFRVALSAVSQDSL